MSWQPVSEVAERIDRQREYEAEVRLAERRAALARMNPPTDFWGRVRPVKEPDHPTATYEQRRSQWSGWITSWWWICGEPCGKESRKGFTTEAHAARSHAAHVLMMGDG